MDFMNERITEDAGEEFAPSRYGLKSKNDSIVKPYGTYELFFEITFQVLQKLGEYEDIGTPEECRKAMERQRGKNPVKDEYNHDCCPTCGWVVYQEEYGGRYLPHCENCGQAIDWDN